MTIGDRIRQRRKALGMTQTELANKCGYTDRSSINKVEMADRGLPVTRIEKIAKALDMKPAELCGWT